ncbi:MAG: DedA family protein [Myxococcota bacterium]
MEVNGAENAYLHRVEDIIAFMEREHGPLPYAMLALSGILEVVFPPWPGDVLVMAGALLAANSEYVAPYVYAASTVGSTLGGLAVHAVGEWAGSQRERWPRMFRGPRTERAIDAIVQGFRNRGGAYLAINRFWPSMRALFFLAAGVAKVPRWQVVVFGGISAAAWTGLIFGLSWVVGHNLDRMRALYRDYTLGTTVVMIVLAAGWLAWRGFRRPPRPPAPGPPLE